MKKILDSFDEKFRNCWSNYILQSFYAALAIFIVLLFLSMSQVVIVAAVGATAFIIFAIPSSVTARKRNVLGGYVVGIIIGGLFALIPHEGFILSAAVYSLAVGFSIFIMVLIDTEHPPASGVTLGVVTQGFSLSVAITTLSSIIILILIHRFFRHHLKDLI